MPVVAVIGGIASATAGVAAFGAAATTMGSIMAGLQIVGGVASALGGLTGNKKLQKFGMFASLGAAAVGGISSLVSSGTEAAASAGSSIMDGATSVAKTAPSYGEWAAANAADSAAIPMSGIEGEVASLTGAGSVGTSTSPWAASSTPANAGMLGTSAAQSATAAAPFDPATATRASNFAPSTSTEMAAAQAALGRPDTGSGVFQGFSNFLTKNPELTKVGMGMLSGFGQSYMQEQKLKEEARVREADRARFNASITGQRQTY